MTNKIALALAALIGAVLVLDFVVFGWDIHIFLGRRLLELTEYLAFWR